MEKPLQTFLNDVKTIVIPEFGARVNRTVAEAVRETFTPEATIQESEDPPGASSETLTIFVEGEGSFANPEGTEALESWIAFAVSEQGAVLSASHRHFLFGLFCLVRDSWSREGMKAFQKPRVQEPVFPGIIGFDGHYGFWRRFTEGYEPESAMQEYARLGCRYVAVNSLPNPNAFEKGVNGEIYHRFYQYLPDIDQYVDTKLNRGIYPQEYLQANLNFLKKQSALAVKYGLTPGMQIANPRSAPGEFFEKYPYLRGPRIDHTFRSYLPRYTMTLSHPLVRWHYATLLETLLKEIPELGFMSTLINDSGSGFEYTESLYAGRNGGPYMVREWRPHDEIARAASKLVLQYYQLMRDTARKVNPDFRWVVGLNNIEEEKQIIYDGLGDGIDRLERTQRYDSQENLEANRDLEARGSLRVSSASAEGDFYILGIPSPWKTAEGILKEKEFGTTSLELDFDPPSKAPFDPNRTVAHSLQFSVTEAVDVIVKNQAVRWVGPEHAESLVQLWRKTDSVSRAFPVWGLYGNQGFVWYRFWTRPFVPDIGKIPVRDRFYYEEYLLSHFNNPHNVDFKADMLWDILTDEQCVQDQKTHDEVILPDLREAIEEARSVLKSLKESDAAYDVFIDLRDRLQAYLCFARTLRNVAAWIVHVHSFLNTEDSEAKKRHSQGVQALIDDELENARDLLELWETSPVHFMPIHSAGEWMHDYGPNFGQLVERKIELMEQYRDHEPYIDPNFMWKLPDTDDIELAPDIDPEEYLKY